ncbi:hypothetical protein [Streptomyces sp. NPDC006309]|uniref:hypothetical protein n=1 Tax=Streptomyces sp. NPDC006309 TaxID=3156749 RepID=UPI0033A8F103
MPLAVPFAAQTVAVSFMVETAGDRRGARRSLRPHLSVPLAARRSLLRTGSGVIAVRAPGGSYCSLGPSLALAVRRTPLPAAGCWSSA